MTLRPSSPFSFTGLQSTVQQMKPLHITKLHKECSKERYIGESSRPLKGQIKEHVDYVKGLFPTQAMGRYFNMPVHSLSKITIIEKVTKYDVSDRYERKKLLVLQFNTLYQGLNRQP